MSDSKKKFVYDASSIKKQAEDTKKKQASRGGFTGMKLDNEKSTVLILPPTGEGKPLFFEACYHEVWKRSPKPELVMRVASPTFVQEKDPVMAAGFKLKKRFADSKNKTLKDLWKLYMPKQETYVNCLDIAELKAGPKVLKLPKIAFDALLAEMEDVDYDLETICDLDSGRPMVIRHNGLKGTLKRYDNAKFLNLKEPLNLKEKGKVDEDKIIAACYDLTALQPAQSETDLQKLLTYLNKQVDRILEKEGVSGDDDGDELETVEDSESSSDDEEFELE